MKGVTAGLLLALLLAAGSAAAALAPTLRANVVVEAEVIRLGDIFANVGPKENMPVAAAPAPGRRAVYDSDWLSAIARSYKLSWRPSTRFDRVVVERASQTIGPGEIEAAVHAALVERGVSPETEVELDSRLLSIHVPTDVAVRLTVPDLWLDRTTDRFSAMLVIPGDERPLARSKVTGRLHRIVQIPVLERQVMPGEVVEKGDITWIKVRAETVHRNVLSEAGAIVGKTPRRPARPDEPLRVGNFQDPVVVAKGSLVTIVLKTPTMILTAQGRAVEDGGRGDVIRVMNTRSKKIVEGVVSRPGTVSVEPTLTVTRR